MKNLTILLSFLIISHLVFAQQICLEPSQIYTTTGNNIQAKINNWGYPFYDGTGNVETFISTVNNDQAASTVFLSGLWLGGLDPAGNLKLSIANYTNSSFIAGPITNDLLPDSMVCINWDKIWVISKSEIENHLADFADNGIIDEPIATIFSWPANGNDNFASIEGFLLPQNDQSLAPFFDSNEDGNYQPENGEFPLPNQVSENSIPQEITYCLFNDLSFTDNFDPLRLQIGQTTYTYDCEANNPLNNTIFVGFQMTNKGLETVDSMYFGMFTDFDLGCYDDDFMGSDSSRNAFFAYNSDNLDGNIDGVCPPGIPHFGENPPVQAIRFLNQPLSNFAYFKNGAQTSSPGTQDPNAAIEYYRYMTGSWRDGSPLEFGGDGYQEGTIQTNFSFPDDPNNSDGWSMLTANVDNLDHRTIASSKIGRLDPGNSFSFDMA